MLDALVVFASEEGGSQALFYIFGGLAAVYAVVVATIGIRQPDFPRDRSQARAVFGASALIVLLAMGSAVVTS